MRKKYYKVLLDQIRERGWRWGYQQVVKYFKILISASVGKPLTGPISVVLMLTYRCNHRCRMCDFPERFDPELEEMDTTRVKQLLTEIAALSGGGISFYGGEPLLRKDLVELVAFARKLGLTVHITSNGFSMTEELAESLIRAGTSIFTISLDGATPEVNDRQRGVVGAFNNAVAAIRYLKAAREKLKTDTRLVVASTLTPHNLSGLASLFELVRGLGVDNYTIFEAQSLAEMPNSFSEQEINRLRAVNTNLIELKKQYPDFIDNSKAYLKIVQKLLSGKKAYLKCFAPYTDIFIDPYGYVFPCNYFLGMNQAAGRLKPGELSRFWYSQEYQKTRKRLAGCGKCDYLCHRELSLLFNRLWPFSKPEIAPLLSREIKQGMTSKS